MRNDCDTFAPLAASPAGTVTLGSGLAAITNAEHKCCECMSETWLFKKACVREARARQAGRHQVGAAATWNVGLGRGASKFEEGEGGSA